MIVLVTGSNGFIGRHVCAYLKQSGCNVIGLGRRAESATDYVDNYLQCELSSGEAAHALDTVSADAVIHLASDMRKGPHEKEILTHNCLGTQQLLDACAAKGIGVFVQLSSLPVIGEPKEHPITETHPIHPPTFYHLTKRTQEMQAQYASEAYGIRTVSIRISAPIGPGMKKSTIFPTFVRCAAAGKNLTIFGKGTRRQTYIPVQDIARALYAAILSEKAQGLYNLGSNILLSNLELAKTIVAVLDSRSGIVFNGLPDPEDGRLWDVNMDRFQNDTGYQPEGKLPDAICEYAAAISSLKAGQEEDE